ncbi:MAG: TIGR03619 family F420-dependent LLM class oxidoreductase [bacterium]|nr:TIGR03619 family F420-dependent LLM class oxidoreductase [bacterium]
MDFWLSYIDEDPHQTIEVARMAEAAGFRGMALADHVAVPLQFDAQHPSGGPAPFDHRSDFPDPLVTAATVLASTKTLEVMTYVYVLPLREPFSVANQVATLDLLCPGRFRFGVGAGWLTEEIALLGHPVRGRGRRMDEMLEIIRRFWTEEEVEFHGEFFDFPPTGVAPKPAGPIPIWVGGKSAAALDRAVAQDGWLGMNYELPEVHALLADLARRLADRGKRDPAGAERFEIFVIPNAEPSEDLYQDLASRGVTATMGMAWGYHDRAFDGLEAKKKAIDLFASRFLSA